MLYNYHVNRRTKKYEPGGNAMTQRDIYLICNEDLKKAAFTNAWFITLAEGGAMGEPGAVYIVTAGGSVFHCNYVFGDVDFGKLCRAIPVIKNLDVGTLGYYEETPDGWHHEYLGAGNHLLIRNDVYEEFKQFIDDKMLPSDLYSMWFDNAFQIIEEHNAGKDPREIKTKAELELIKKAQSRSGNKQEQIIDEFIQEELEAGYDPFEDERVYVTSELVHGDDVSPSLRVQEGLFDDYRSYLSEMWCEDQAIFVTYYFPVDDPLRGRIQNNEKAIEAYLIGQRKLFAGEEHHLGIMVLDTKEGEVYSVTVCVALEDEYFCEAYL